MIWSLPDKYDRVGWNWDWDGIFWTCPFYKKIISMVPHQLYRWPHRLSRAKIATQINYLIYHTNKALQQIHNALIPDCWISGCICGQVMHNIIIKLFTSNHYLVFLFSEHIPSLSTYHIFKSICHDTLWDVILSLHPLPWLVLIAPLLGYLLLARCLFVPPLRGLVCRYAPLCLVLLGSWSSNPSSTSTPSPHTSTHFIFFFN